MHNQRGSAELIFPYFLQEFISVLQSINSDIRRMKVFFKVAMVRFLPTSRVHGEMVTLLCYKLTF